MSSAPTDYGSVDVKDPADHREQSYDIDNTYYVRDRSLTWKERTRKLLLIGIPILAAFLIMGGFAFFLLHDFGVLYPHSGAGNTDNDKSSVIQTPRNYFSGDYKTTAPRGPRVPSPVSPSGGSETKKKSSSGPSACADNINCDQLGLVGQCCPTPEDVFLGCCD